MRDLSPAALVLLGLLAMPAAATGQARSSPHTTAELRTLVPGPGYEAGMAHRLFFGSRWRDLWTTPIRVPVLDLEGLTVRDSTGGGDQTPTLRFDASDGTAWRFRSADKEPARGLPPELRGTLAEEVVQDQVSALHPAAAPVVGAIMDAVGALHPDPRLVVLPDDSLLGPYRSAFGGRLGILEREVRGARVGGPGFLNAYAAMGTDELLAWLRADPTFRVAAREYLTVRLVDILVGDRARGPGQWKWIPESRGARTAWRPVALDRDQAFYGLDGLYGRVLRGERPEHEPFRVEYGSIRWLTWSAWGLDRRFLVGLDRRAWDSVAVAVRNAVTDSVIEAAVSRLPPGLYEENAGFLRRALRNRRDHLLDAAGELYRIVSHEAVVEASDRDEVVVVDRRFDGSVEVQVFPPAGPGTESPHFRRRFLPDETDEVRLFCRGGDDRIFVRGDPAREGDPITVKAVGGAGADAFETTTDPHPLDTELYDHGPETVFSTAPGTRVDRREFEGPRARDSAHPGPVDWGSHWFAPTELEFNSDHGVILKTGRIRYGYDFRRLPYAHRLKAMVGVSTDGRFLAEYESEVRRIRPWFDLVLHTRFAGTDKDRFYGFGNDTPRRRDDFHRVTRYHLTADPRIRLPLTDGLTFSLGPLVQWSSTVNEEDRILQEAGAVYGEGTFWQAGGRATLELQATDHPVWPTRGARGRVQVDGFGELLDAVDPYQTLKGEVAGYLPLSGGSTLALRLGGGRAFGDSIPFHDAPMVGGERVRGLNTERLRGDASLYGSVELRVSLFRIRLPWVGFPSEVGALGFTDAGRVWVDGASPGGWHLGGGAGFWVAPVKRAFTLRAAISHSEETRLEGGIGFAF